jgi:hypothetical protein
MEEETGHSNLQSQEHPEDEHAYRTHRPHVSTARWSPCRDDAATCCNLSRRAAAAWAASDLAR